MFGYQFQYVEKEEINLLLQKMLKNRHIKWQSLHKSKFILSYCTTLRALLCQHMYSPKRELYCKIIYEYFLHKGDSNA